MRPPRLRRLRLALWAAAAAGAAYLLWRFETLRLPEEGCSPVLAFAPGEPLLVDLHPSAVGPGDVVLFRHPEDGPLALGRISAPPPGTTPEAEEALAGGALWIAGDRPGCPSRDSRLLGPIPRAALRGRVLLGL